MTSPSNGKSTMNDFNVPEIPTTNDHLRSLLHDTDDIVCGSHDVFCELDVLYKNNDTYQWRETARWVKYEERVEKSGKRWSKPHVASLSLHSLFELRSYLTTGVCLLELEAKKMSQVTDSVLGHLVSQNLIEESNIDNLRPAMIASHWFMHQKDRFKNNSCSDADGESPMMCRKRGMKSAISGIVRSVSETPGSPNGKSPDSPFTPRLNRQFMKKIPGGSEAASIMVGEINGLDKQAVAFIRLAEGIPDITEVPIPTKFIFFLFGPPGSNQKNVAIGRAMATVMVDEIFREVAHKAGTRDDILKGLDEFLYQVTALPPGQWDPEIRIEPPRSVPSPEKRRRPSKQIELLDEEEDDPALHCPDPTLFRTGRLFGGLVADIKRKLPWYGSDFKDCLHIQCVASTIFLYLATLTPNVTFGGLLGKATDQYLGTMECILAASVCGVLFALFSGQPLNILGSTGPMLVLEMILYRFCKEFDLDFLPFRAWIGLWTSCLCLLIVAFDLSALVKYITRFTEESFACLIAVIFIAEAFKKLIHLLDEAPVNTDPDAVLNYTCTCLPPNTTHFNVNLSLFKAENKTETIHSYIIGFNSSGAAGFKNGDLPNLKVSDINWPAVSIDNCSRLGGIPVTVGCDTPHYVPDAFFLSVLLFIGTFIIAMGLTNAKSSSFFPSFVRQVMSDFAVLIAIVSMVLVDLLIGINTPKLHVPTKFKPTSDARGWFINPFCEKNPTWIIFAAILPAMFAVILIFMDQQITAVIVNRKENKLQKGSGYHLDMFVVAICIAICSVFGLPWFVAATVSALAHVMSLTKESECTAPGERPMFLGVREQRVTGLLVGILSGLSVLFTSVLSHIPMAVLYGVFLYMGVAALNGMQFVDRVLLFFKPTKYQPDYTYLRHVRIKRVHVFTLIQIMCVVVLWLIKTSKNVSIIFPLKVLGMVFVRKAMDYVFSQDELKWLDDLMPDAMKKAREDARRKKLEALEAANELESEAILSDPYTKVMEIKMNDQQLYSPKLFRRSVKPHDIKIGEEVERMGMWLQLQASPKTDNGLSRGVTQGNGSIDETELANGNKDAVVNIV